MTTTTTKSTGVKVELVDEATNKVVETYYVAKLKIGSNARRYALFNQINDGKMSESLRNQYIGCINLACTLTDKNGNLLYPLPDDGKPDDAHIKIFEEMDPSVFYMLTEAYNDVNPLSTGLKAKKKRY